MTTQQPTPLESIWQEIDDKADTYARNQSGYILDGNELGAENNPQKHNYDRIKRHCKALATQYGERLVAAEKLIEKMAKALDVRIELDKLKEEDGFQKGFELQTKVIRLTDQARNDYQTYLKTREDGSM